MEVDIDLQSIKQDSIYLIRDLKLIFDNRGIVFWLDQGTLLGAVRDKDFLAWDDDIDLAVWKADLDKNPQIWNDFRKAGYLVFFFKKIQTVRIERKKQRIGWRSVEIHCYDKMENKAVKYFQKPKRLGLQKFFGNIIRTIDMICEAKNGPDLRYKNIEKYIDGLSQSKARIRVSTFYTEKSPLWKSSLQIFGYMLPNRLLFYLKHIVSQLRLNFCTEVIYLETPSHFFQDLEIIDFLGIQVRTPTPVREYLCFKYGDNWETPRRAWVYYKDDGAIKSAIS